MDNQADFGSMVPRALRVITAPDAFFRTMPKTGGFVDPIAFLIVIGIIDGLITWIAAVLNPAIPDSAVGASAVLVVMPVTMLLMGFVVATLMFFLWKIMGSREGFETAFRSVAYMVAISPITTAIGFFSYLNLIGLLWSFYLLAIASIEVHRIPPRVAWTVFGVIAALFVILSLGLQRAGRIEGDLHQYQRQLDETNPRGP